MSALLSLLWMFNVTAPVCAAARPGIGFLTGEPSVAQMGPEGQAAWALMRKLFPSAALLRPADGRLLSEEGAEVAPNRLRVVWIHQGDSTDEAGPLYDAKTVALLKQYVGEGGGLFLSGAALGMVVPLGVEPVVPRRGGPGDDRSEAALVPLATKHPAFCGLPVAGSVVRISDGGYPAFADFHALGGPSTGVLLARTPGGMENPLAEYAAGKGRIVVLGWRLPRYSYLANPYRATLERLTSNLLHYLGDKSQWQKVVVKPVPGPVPVKIRPGVPDGQFEALRRAVDDLTETFGERYPRGGDYLQRLARLAKRHAELSPEGKDPDEKATAQLNELGTQFAQLRQEALLANPLLDFGRLLLVKRGAGNLGLPQNWESNSSLRMTGYDNELDVLSPVGPSGELTTLFRPANGEFVGDVDLQFSGKKMLFSMPGPNGRWQLFELNADGSGLRQLPLVEQPDVDNYDACYLPDGTVLFTSTAAFVGVPCVTGSSHVANLFLLEAGTGRIRQLTFDQDHAWCPTMLNNGRVLFLRWEYADLPHFAARILFSMNPDGTDQKEFYGSNSYWPNAMFYARPIPGSATQFVTIVGGHHDNPRMGELVLFDAAQGRHEAEGALQRILGYGKPVEPILLDGLTANSWPKFLHPWPLSSKYFLVSAKPTPQSNWGLYLADVFDNLLLIRETPGYALLEPVPLRPAQAPPVVRGSARAEPADPTAPPEALVYMADVYAGPGLAGVPRGTVKKLRLFTYHFAYHGMGGQVNRVGLDGPWDIKQIVGTVPVAPDGSAYFRVPANTPLSLQPLDAEGKALQLMRSWLTAMPGETLSCVGCHEQQSEAPPVGATAAAAEPPATITPWYGPTRGFSFIREVQPVLDVHCVRCHDGKQPGLPDFCPAPSIHPQAKDGGYNNGTQFTPAYLALRSYVRAPTLESDMHLLPPAEFHADTTRLMQLLNKGHHGVRLDPESADRLITWIDLNTPAHGTWHEIVGEQKVDHQRDRRRAMMKLYAGRDEDPEAILDLKVAIGKAAEGPRGPIRPLGPIDPMQTAPVVQKEPAASPRAFDLGDGVALELIPLPAGEFLMGDANGFDDEQPVGPMKIDQPFWMGKFEITNEQFARFDPAHDSRLEHGDFLQFSVQERGYPLNNPDQPVCRVSWNQAAAFCRWLTEKTGKPFALPTEPQWEYACRAGTTTPLWYGEESVDFAKYANLADASLRRVDTFGWGLPSGAVPEWRPAVAGVDDGHRVSAPVGSYVPNAWGLHDMHGNVAEWTSTSYGSYPSPVRDPGTAPPKVVRGGSWYDRPHYARSSYRVSYPAWQGVYNVGFRVVCVKR